MAKRRPWASKDPRCRKGREVTFTIPQGAPNAGKTVTGKVLDCIQSDDATGGWGTYRYFAELVEWDWGIAIRLTYWRKKPGDQEFGHGGQYSISADRDIFKQLVDGMLKNNWFSQDPTQS